MFNFRFKVFYSVAINQSFTKAAEELYITQPAVTKNIKELEKSLGIDVFERNKSGLLLTKAGKILFAYTVELLDQENRLLYEIGLLKQDSLGNLKIGASTTIGQYVLPKALAKFSESNSKVNVSLLGGNTEEIEMRVEKRELDLGIVEGRFKRKELKYIPFMKDEIVLVCHGSQALSKLDKIDLEELKSTPIILREIGSGTLDVIIEKLKENQVSLKDMNILMHLGSTESIKSFLKHSNCLGFVSINAIYDELINNDFKRIEVDKFEIIRNFSFIQTQGQQNGLVDTFIEFCSKVLRP